ASEVLLQAKAVLWLLCRYGGAGSKARKGFGSLAVDRLDDMSLEWCLDAASELRMKLGLAVEARAGSPTSPALTRRTSLEVEVPFSWPDVWSVLDQAGFAYQAFAKRFAHDGDRE